MLWIYTVRSHRLEFLSVCLSVCLTVCLLVCLCVCLSICLCFFHFTRTWFIFSMVKSLIPSVELYYTSFPFSHYLFQTFFSLIHTLFSSFFYSSSIHLSWRQNNPAYHDSCLCQGAVSYNSCLLWNEIIIKYSEIKKHVKNEKMFQNIRT